MPARDRVEVDIVAKTKKANKSLIDFALKAGAAYLSIRTLTRGVQAMVKAYAVQEQAEAKLAGALQATGEMSHSTHQSLIDYAGALQETTTYGDEATISAMALLQSLGDLNEKGIKALMPLIQDFATGMGVDLQTAASLVGKTMGSTTNALSRYGIIIDATAPKQEKLAALAGALEEKFGGMSATMAQTATGSAQQLSNAFGDLMEVGGGAIANMMEPMNRTLTKMIQNLTESIGKVQALDKAAREMAEGGIEQVSEKEVLLESLNKTWKQLDTQIRTAAEAQRKYGQEGAEFLGQSAKQVEILEEQRAAVARRITELRSLIQQEERLAGLDEKAAAAAKAEAKRQEKLAFWTNERVRIQGELGEQFKVIIQRQELFGDAVDAAAEKEGALRKALEEMLKLGFTVGGAGVENILRFAEAWGVALDAADAAAEGIKNTTTAYQDQLGVLENINDFLSEQKGKTNELADAWDNFANNTLTNFGSIYSETIANATQMAIEHADAWKRNKEIIKEAAASILLALSRELAIYGAKALIPALGLFNPAAAAVAFAASAAAAAGAGYIRSLAQGGQFVTSGSEMMRVGDNPGGRERVTVEPISSQGRAVTNTVHVKVILDSKTLYSGIHKATRDGTVLIDARAVR